MVQTVRTQLVDGLLAELLEYLRILRASANVCCSFAQINLLFCIPVSGGYSEWSDWTNCTADCGGGEQVRSRTCTNPVPEFVANDCTLIGESLEKRECNKIPCSGIPQFIHIRFTDIAQTIASRREDGYETY
jgi:hypothetical protein